MYNIIAIDECGTDVVVQAGFPTSDAAYRALPDLREEYEEYRGFGVELNPRIAAEQRMNDEYDDDRYW